MINVNTTCIKNAKITSASIFVEDHGILTSYLQLDYAEGSTQGFGGYALDSYNKATDKREPHIGLSIWVKGIMDTLDVDYWDKLPGTPVRVALDSNGWNATIIGIGHFLNNKWFEPKVAFKEFRE